MSILKRRKKVEEISQLESFTAVVIKDSPVQTAIDYSNNFAPGLTVKDDQWASKQAPSTNYSKPSIPKKPERTGEPIYVKINMPMKEEYPPKEENLEFITFSKIDGFPVFKYWGDYRYLSNIYPCEELIQTVTK